MAQLPDGTLLGGIAFDTDAIIGAGGWITRLAAADDGTMVCGSDAAGPRIRRAADKKWRKLFIPGQNISASLVTPARAGHATYDVAVCATDSDVAYWITGGCLWKTVDGGGTAQITALVDIVGANPNEWNRMCGKHLAVDPENPDVVFAGTPAGLRYTDDGGASIVSVEEIPLPAMSDVIVSRYIIAFDRSSAVVGGKTQGIYVFSCALTGSGLYHSTDGGGTWTNVAGGPVMAAHMRVSPHDGFVHLAGDAYQGSSTAPYRRWDGESWITPVDGNSTAFYGKSIAVSPHNPGHIYMANDGGHLRVSTDNGVSWSFAAAPVRKAIDIPWHEWCNEYYMSNGDIEFDQSSNRLWMAEGIGAWTLASPPTTGVGSVDWVEASVGMENMVSNIMTCDPQGRLLYSCHDRRGYVIEREDVGKRFPPIHGLGPGTSIAHGGNIDYAPNNPDVMVMPVWVSAGGYTTNAGASWEVIPGDVRAFANVGGVTTAVGGGTIAAISDQVWVQRMTHNGMVFWTKNAGTTWEKLVIGADLEFYGSCHAYWACHAPLAKDRYVENQAFLYFVGIGDGTPDDLAYRGIWRLNYNPTTEAWTTTRVKGPSNPTIMSYGQDYWHGNFVQIGLDDWLWYGQDNAIGLWRSTDAMATWSQVTGTDDVNSGSVPFGECYGVGVGAGRTPETKTLFACGFRTAAPVADPTTFDKFGFWLSEDLGASWVRITQFCNGCTTHVSGIAADPEVYGLFYAGNMSEGVSRFRYQDKRALS